jgi:peptidoglycan/LPS O-acetylase OafA/YrhL
MAIVGIDRVQLAMPSGCADEARHPSTARSSVQSSDKPRRFVFVDALRGIAAMWVVVYHAFESKRLTNLEPLLPNWTAQLIHSAYLAVTVFFVLSGFVIAHSVARRRVDAPYVGWFMLRRAVRLDPPYWASILAIIVREPAHRTARLANRARSHVLPSGSSPAQIDQPHLLDALPGVSNCTWCSWCSSPSLTASTPAARIVDPCS